MEYLTDGFFQNLKVKTFFLSGQFIILAFFFIQFYSQRNQQIMMLFRAIAMITMVFMGRIMTFAFFVLKKNLQNRKNHFKRLLFLITFDLFYFIHVYILKQNVTYFILSLLRANFLEATVLEIFKLFLLVYYSFYQFMINKFLYYLYKNIVLEDQIQIDIVIQLSKFLYLETQIITLMNILSISLTMPGSWISYFNYVYSLFSTYSGSDPVGQGMGKIIGWIFRRKPGIFENKPENLLIEFKKLKSGCIYEANLIICCRILLLKISPYYYYFTTNFQLFADCSMRLRSNFNEIEVANMFLVFATQIATVLGIGVYMLQKKNALINIQIEDYLMITRMVVYFNIFTYLDFNIQIYEGLNQEKNNDFF